jgi:hypothetical protein
VARLLAAMPNLEELVLHHLFEGPCVTNSASVLVANMAKPPVRDTIHLGRLKLSWVRVDRDSLASMLESQKDSVHTVSFYSVSLTGSGTWPRALAAVRSADKMVCMHLDRLNFWAPDGVSIGLKFPKQSLKDYIQRTGAHIEITGRGVHMFPPTCIKSVLEIILQFIDGEVTFL